MELYQILLLAFAAIVVVLYLVYKIWGHNALQKVALTKPVIAALASAVQALSKVWNKSQLGIVFTILKAGAQAADFAEQAWLMGELAKEERNEYAKNLSRSILMKAGITVDERVDMIIAGMIQAVCVLLPHGVQPKV